MISNAGCWSEGRVETLEQTDHIGDFGGGAPSRNPLYALLAMLRVERITSFLAQRPMSCQTLGLQYERSLHGLCRNLREGCLICIFTSSVVVEHTLCCFLAEKTAYNTDHHQLLELLEESGVAGGLERRGHRRGSKRRPNG